MLAECVEKCPDDLWTAGANPRTFWRIALHAAFFTHLYLGQSEAAFRPWAGGPPAYASLWKNPAELEPYELPDAIEPLSRRETLDYIAFVASLIDPTVDQLDLESSDSGFRWYPRISKLSHQMMNLRHIQGHVGQLSELLMSHGIDTRWIAKAGAAT